MANQIQKKFILDGAVDGLKIKLLKDQALVGTLQDGSSVDLIKLDGSDKVLVKGVEVGLKSEIDQSLVDAKAYADQKITDLVNGADVALDTLKEIGDQLASDQNAVNALVTTVANNLTEAKGYADTVSTQALVDAKAYTDAEIAAIPSVDLSNIEADISTLQGQVSTIEGEISTLQSNVSALQSAKVLTFEKELFTAAAPLTDISLAHQAVEKSLVVFVGRLALHAGEDYTVSVVGGVTKLTWAGDFAVGGVEGIEAGDKIKVTYAYLA